MIVWWSAEGSEGVLCVFKSGFVLSMISKWGGPRRYGGEMLTPHFMDLRVEMKDAVGMLE